MTTPAFPFSAIVGQEAMKRALLLNAVDPAIGGVLIRGEKGTAKSTAVRALQALLPEIEVVEGCPLNCAPGDPPNDCPWCAERFPAGAARPLMPRLRPVVELPVSATEDRVAGSFDLEEAIQRGERRFEPGLLAAANRGILYVDEVNLLPDHLVDVVLDAAAGGLHRVEREGISVVHAARFLLVGTMNPEEGELRPQLLDRFGLAVEVAAPRDPAERTAVVRRRIAYDRDAAAFAAQWARDEAGLCRRVARAARLLPRVRLDDALLDLIAQICLAYEVDGLRADVAAYKAAVALAALDGRKAATPEDVRAAAELALPHRRRRQPFDEPGFDRRLLDDLVAEFQARSNGDSGGARDGHQAGGATSESVDDGTAGAVAPNGRPKGGGASSPPASGLPPGGAPDGAARNGAGAARPDRRFDPAPVTIPEVLDHVAGARRGGASRTSRQGRHGPAGKAERGRNTASVVQRLPGASVALDATIRAAAPYQWRRQVSAAVPVRLARHDLRFRRRAAPAGRLLLFVVDASGSMAGRRRIALAKGAIEALLLDAYRRRDQVAMIAFRGQRAELVLPPTNSVDLARRKSHDLPAGGRTPLAAALDLAHRVVARYLDQGRGGTPAVVVLSDGRANVALDGGDPWESALRAAARLRRLDLTAAVVDAGGGGFDLGFTAALAQALGAPRFHLPLNPVPGPKACPEPAEGSEVRSQPARGFHRGPGVAPAAAFPARWS